MRTTPPPVDRWAELGDREHLVQFYEDSQTLVETLKGFIGSGLRAGGAGVVIASPAHLEALERQLAADGIDVAAVKKTRAVRRPRCQRNAREGRRERLAPTRVVPLKVGAWSARRRRAGARCAPSAKWSGCCGSAADKAPRCGWKALWNDLQRNKRSHCCAATTSVSCARATTSSSAAFAPCTGRHRSTRTSRSRLATRRACPVDGAARATRATPGARAAATQSARSTRRRARDGARRFSRERSRRSAQGRRERHVSWANRAELDLLG